MGFNTNQILIGIMLMILGVFIIGIISPLLPDSISETIFVIGGMLIMGGGYMLYDNYRNK